MLRFHALAVECFSEFEEVLTVHFDDEAEHYLALQVWVEDCEENAAGLGMVHVEVDDQINSGYDCFRTAELRRGSFHMTFDSGEPSLAELEGVEVTFDLADEEFEQLRAALGRVFRDFKGYRLVAGKAAFLGSSKTPADSEPRPLTAAEAHEVFDAMAARGDQIAFKYVRAGCESRAQLMIEYMEQMGINPGRAWALSVGRDLAITGPLFPRGRITWNNHVAPTVAVESAPHRVLVIDPSLSTTGPVTLHEWAGVMRARTVEVSLVPLTQSQIMDLQTARVTGGGQPIDAIIFSLERGTAPLPDLGGSGFRVGADPTEGVSAFAHRQQQNYLKLQSKMRPGQPWPTE
jgi:hypothetical protein